MPALRKFLRVFLFITRLLVLFLALAQMGLWTSGSSVGSDLHLFGVQGRTYALYVMLALMIALPLRAFYDWVRTGNIGAALDASRGSLQVEATFTIALGCSILFMVYR